MDIRTRVGHAISTTGATILIACLFLPGCSKDDDDADLGLSLTFSFPDSLTGGRVNTANKLGIVGTSHQSGLPCAFLGPDEGDSLRNGYQMTKLMISAVARWTCVADTAIAFGNFLPHDGQIYETGNDPQSPSYNSKDPTHFSISDDSDSQTSIRAYYGFELADPPTMESIAGLYVSWIREEAGDIHGRMIVDAREILKDNVNLDDPVMLRLDFTQDADTHDADMFLQYDVSHNTVEGFRINVSEDMAANPGTQVFLARGLMAMKGQYLPAPGVDEIPVLAMYTVANRIGDGAALAEMSSLALPLPLNTETGNHLGNYLFDKTDLYYFDDDQSSDYINKTISRSEYRGGRTTPDTGGSWLPFDPSLDMIISQLELDADYFSNGKCENIGDSCNELLNGIFHFGFAGQEQNLGEEPDDWRKAAIAQAVFLDSIYPNGENWEGAFDRNYNP